MDKPLALQAHEFFSAYNTNPTAVEHTTLRNLLDGYAGPKGPKTPHGFAAWAQLLSILVQPCGHPYAEQDCARLWSYFEELHKHGVEVLLADGDEDDVVSRDPNGVVVHSKPAYDGLFRVAVEMLNCAVQRHPLIEPSARGHLAQHAVLVLLNECFDQQVAYAKIIRGHVHHLKHTALGAWLSVLAPMITDDNWMPPAHEVYLKFWTIRSIPSSNQYDAQTHYTAHASALMHKCPMHAIGGIEAMEHAMKDSHFWPQKLWDCFFPLPLNEVPVDKTSVLLVTLVKLLHSANHHGQTNVERMLTLHHPALMHLLKMHVVLDRSDVMEANDMLYLVNLYLGHAQETVVLDGLLEETSTN